MSGRPKYFFGLVRQLGLLDGARILLRELGLATPISITYPGAKRRFRVRFDPAWKWIDRGIREFRVIRFAQEHIRKGQTVFDIGAHVGEYSLLFSDLVGGEGKVVAFEPDPKA